MSRKRKVKKQRKQQSELGGMLRRLYERGAYPELLTVFHRRVPNPESSEHADLYFGAIDLTLLQTLGRGDLSEAADMTKQLSGRAAARPLVKLARALVAMRDGDNETACGLLEDVATDPEAGAGTTPDLSAVVRPLLEVCRMFRTSARQRLAIEDTSVKAGDLKRLASRLAKLPHAKSKSQPRDIGLIDDASQAAWDLARTMDAVAARGFRPTPRQVTALREATSVLEEHDPVGRNGSRPVAAAARLATLIAVVAEDTRKLRARRPDPRFRNLVHRARSGRYRELERALEEKFEERFLMHLQHTLRVAWHELVELAVGEDPERLMELGTSRASVLESMVRFEERGAKSARASVSAGRTARALVAVGGWSDLADLLDAQAIGEFDPGRLAMLRAVQLRLVWLQAEDEEYEASFLDERFNPHDLFFDEFLPIVAEVGREIPSDQRAGVARFLRDELVQATRELAICTHFGRAAVGLLEHLPHDAVLLIIGVAGHVGVDDRVVNELRRRIADRGPARVVDSDAAAGLITEIVLDTEIEECVEILEIIRPLFADQVWQEVLAPAAATVRDYVVRILNSPLLEVEGPVFARKVLDRVLDGYAPYWGGTLAFEAARATVDCVLCENRSRGEARLEQFHEAFPGVKPALVLFASVARTTEDHGDSSVQRRVLSSLAGWIVDRMEATWRLWTPALPDLVSYTREPDRLMRLEEILNDTIDEDDLDLQARVSIQVALEELSERMDTSQRRGAKARRRMKAAKRAAGKQKDGARPKKAKPSEPDTEDEDVQLAFDFSWE